MPITNEERYSRQVLFPGIGMEGQKLLRQARVAIVGCGAIGSVVASLLARAGVGAMRIIDRDYVEYSNLQRQILFDEADANESLPKAMAAARKIAAFNSEIVVEPAVADLTPSNADDLLSGFQLILDATDNFATRYLINDFAVKNTCPWIYTAAIAAYAITLNILPGDTACLACVFPHAPEGTFETCDTVGILNSVTGAIASIQATEALKILVGAKEKIRRSLLSLDLWSNDRSEISIDGPRADCRCCGAREFVHLAGQGLPPISLCGRNSVQIHEYRHPVNFTEISARLQPLGKVQHNDLLLKFWRKGEDYELTLFPDGRAIIKGTTDTAIARSFYARFVGS